MEAITFQLTDCLAKSESREYWNKSTQKWSTQKPSDQQMRIRSVVHEASSTFLGTECEGGSLDEMYRTYGCDNVVRASRLVGRFWKYMLILFQYVTGPGIFPTAGAWNPTLPMCAFAPDLARRLDAASCEGTQVQGNKRHVEKEHLDVQIF